MRKELEGCWSVADGKWGKCKCGEALVGGWESECESEGKSEGGSNVEWEKSVGFSLNQRLILTEKDVSKG